MNRRSLFFILFFSATSLLAQVELPALFRDNLVLQQQFKAPVWGWASPGQAVLVTGSWDRKAMGTTADRAGRWMVRLTTPAAGGPYFITINSDTIRNVMIGEVWICSGQSNMQWPMKQTGNAKEEIIEADFPNIRLFHAARTLAEEPVRDCKGQWLECTPESVEKFSAVAYFFGRDLHLQLDIPIGLINASYGGSPIQAWINHNVLQSVPEGRSYLDKYDQKKEAAGPGADLTDNHAPSVLYNAMIHPLIPFGIRGAIWYQGEANAKEHDNYRNLLKTMITSWRDEWGQGDFPFYFVQLSPFSYAKKMVGAAMRDEMRRALEIPNTGMAITMDIGAPDDIHPKNKKEVGHRLALIALARIYGRAGFEYSGPLYSSMSIEGNKIRLSFKHAENGLVCKGRELTHFTMAGKDKKFYPAKAIIDGHSILVSSEKVNDPLAVRFAFNNTDAPNLFNHQGLPASTFRTDDWNIVTATAFTRIDYNAESDRFIVSMEAEAGQSIRYTLDGSEPSAGSLSYSTPFTLVDDALITTRIFVGGEPSLYTDKTKLERHLATGKKVTYKRAYSERYTAGGEKGLVNSIFGSIDFKDGNWQGFQGNDLKVVIDLEEPMPVSEVRVNCLQLVKSWIVFPKSVEVYTSENGRKFRLVKAVDQVIPPEAKGAKIHTIKVRFDTREPRYLKVVAKNYGRLPAWHESAGDDSWLFVDEILVK